MRDKGLSNTFWVLLVVGGFLIVTAVIIAVVVWMKGGTDVGAKCAINLLRGAAEEGCRIFG